MFGVNFIFILKGNIKGLFKTSERRFPEERQFQRVQAGCGALLAAFGHPPWRHSIDFFPDATSPSPPSQRKRRVSSGSFQREGERGGGQFDKNFLENNSGENALLHQKKANLVVFLQPIIYNLRFNLLRNLLFLLFDFFLS